MAYLTFGKLLKVATTTGPLEVQMAQNARALGQQTESASQKAAVEATEAKVESTVAKQAVNQATKQATKRVDGIISKTLRVQKQADEHIIGGSRLGTNSYLNSVDDATSVLNAAHSGEAKVLSTNLGQNRAYVQYHNVTGYYNNNGVIIPTNKFLIKGGNSSTVVPIHPNSTTFK